MGIDGSALTRLREARKLSQGELARKAGISRAQVGRWETGKRGADPGFGMVCRLAEALDVPPWDFMEDPKRVRSQLKIWPGGRPQVKEAS